MRRFFIVAIDDPGQGFHPGFSLLWIGTYYVCNLLFWQRDRKNPVIQEIEVCLEQLCHWQAEIDDFFQALLRSISAYI